MERKLLENHVEIKYEEFLELRSENELAKLFESAFPYSSNYNEFENKLQFIIDTVQDLSKKKNEIRELWDMSYVVINELIEENKYDNYFIVRINQNYFFPLISITGEANFDLNERSQIELKLVKLIKSLLSNLFKQNIDIEIKLEVLIQWYNYHITYLEYFELGIEYGELKYLINIEETNSLSLEELKKYSPMIYLNFIKIIKYCYNHLNIKWRSQYRDYYLKKCYEQIKVARNSENYFQIDILLEDYYREKLTNYKSVNWLFKNLVGYGEKPWRLVILFFAINIFFTSLFTFFDFGFHFTNENQLNIIEKFFTFLSFNNTTMLTVGYGDIYPEGVGARIMVALLQIIGFTISTTTIALFLRKILRF